MHCAAHLGDRIKLPVSGDISLRTRSGEQRKRVTAATSCMYVCTGEKWIEEGTVLGRGVWQQKQYRPLIIDIRLIKYLHPGQGTMRDPVLDSPFRTALFAPAEYLGKIDKCRDPLLILQEFTHARTHADVFTSGNFAFFEGLAAWFSFVYIFTHKAWGWHTCSTNVTSYYEVCFSILTSAKRR